MNFLNSKSVLIISTVWPEPTSSAAGLRDQSLMKCFDGAHKKYLASPSIRNNWTHFFESTGWHCESISANDSDFDQWLLEISPDIVVFDRFIMEEQFGWRVKMVLPEALRVLDTQDLHALRRMRKIELMRSKNPLLETEKALLSAQFDWPESAEGTKDLLRELASIYRCDLTWVISEFELQWLQDHFQIPRTKLAYLPLMYETISKTESSETKSQSKENLTNKNLNKSTEIRKNILWIGNFRHEPNPDGLLWFCTEVWPLLKKAIAADIKSNVSSGLLHLNAIEFHIYGAYVPKEWSTRKFESGIILKGFTENQYETFERYALSVAPLRFGAGLKGKVLDSFFSGTPVVGSGIAFEGICPDWATPLDPSLWVNRILELLQVPENNQGYGSLWFSRQQAQCNLIEEKFSFKKIAEALLVELERAYLLKQKNQCDDWVGRMLWQNQFRATEYFSRWIEQKNKPRC